MNRKEKLRWLVAAGIFGYFTLEGLLRFGYKFLEEKIDDPNVYFLPDLINELTGAYAAMLLIVPVFLFFRKYRLRRDNWLRHLPVLLLGALAYSLVHTTLMWMSREALYPIAGLGDFDYGDMALRYPMEFFNQIVGYFIFALLAHAFFYYLDTRDRELQTARLQAELSEARLRALKAQLHPHFLFNTLNTITSSMYGDVRSADRMMSRLSDLLRAMLEAPPDQEVSLDEELELLALYLEIMKARFGDRLQVHHDVAGEVRDALVPTMVLQPLVENAIRYGVASRSGDGNVWIGAQRARRDLIVEVRDDGPGVSGDPAKVIGKGIGLAATRERLRQLYGADADIELRSATPCGLIVRLRLPYRSATAGIEGGARKRRAGVAGNASREAGSAAAMDESLR